MDPWIVTPEERAQHIEHFRGLHPIDGVITFSQVKVYLLQSGLPLSVLGRIWSLTDVNHDGNMDVDEFSVACKLISMKLKGFEIPPVLPASLKAMLASSVKATRPNRPAAAPPSRYFLSVGGVTISGMEGGTRSPSLQLGVGAAQPLRLIDKLKKLEEPLPQELVCPICSKLPPNEVFQCSNGHNVCSVCATNLVECPQCRVPLEGNKIRNRAMENRLDLSSHLQRCSFSAPAISLCEHIGYSCGFRVNPKFLEETLKHLQHEHGFILSKKSVFDIRLEGMKEVNQNIKSVWTPVVLDLDNDVHKACLLLLVLFYEKNKTVSLICLQLNERENGSASGELSINFNFKAIEPKKIPDLKFTTGVVAINQAVDAIRNPQFTFQLRDLISRYEQDNAILIKCSIGKPSSVEQEERKASTFYLLNSPIGCNQVYTPSAPPLDQI